MRRPRTLVIATAAGGVLLLAWAAVALVVYAQRPQVTGSPAQWYRTSAPEGTVPVTHPGNLQDLRASIAGADASDKLRTTGAGPARELADVADGAHRVRISAEPSRVFGDDVDEDVTIHVDTRKPQLAVDRVPPGWRPVTEIAGRVEP